MAQAPTPLIRVINTMQPKLWHVLVGIIFAFQVNISHAKKRIEIAIVIDDLGYNQHDLQALTLPPAITFSILPYTPYAKKIAALALQQERELLLHIPMQAKANNEKLGKGALLLNMQEPEFKAQLSQTLNTIPEATGINNHMGSSLTEQLKQMQWTMDILDKHGLYFLDSRTSPQTIAESTAKISGVPALHRHIFLDNIKTQEAMQAQLQQAIKLGQDQISIVIIAHPYPETIRFLSDTFNHIATGETMMKIEDGEIAVKLVALQHLLSPSQRLAMAKKRSELRQVNNFIINDAVEIQNKQIQ